MKLNYYLKLFRINRDNELLLIAEAYFIFSIRVGTYSRLRYDYSELTGRAYRP